MAKRERVAKKTASTSKEAEAVNDAPAKKVNVDTLRGEMDDLLGLIDEVLEENAEEFVKAYVQKGGE